MNEKEKLEVARNILHNAVNLNLSKKTILRISEQIDKYIIEYIEKENNKKCI